LSVDLLRTVFTLFDMDGDGRLSYQEFIQIMRERHARRTQCPVNHFINPSLWIMTLSGIQTHAWTLYTALIGALLADLQDHISSSDLSTFDYP
uniref:EF-hand domain-containing protein n=1 Tax=Echinostoma caproni TaxID=27848 RepID=A0A183ACA2_9TREM